eukprot:7627295-Pyramimonas_sp.AAC.1
MGGAGLAVDACQSALVSCACSVSTCAEGDRCESLLGSLGGGRGRFVSVAAAPLYFILRVVRGFRKLIHNKELRKDRDRSGQHLRGQPLGLLGRRRLRLLQAGLEVHDGALRLPARARLLARPPLPLLLLLHQP